MTLFDKIRDLQQVNTLSKHEQLVHGILESIDVGILAIGDQLPSINNMVGELGYARKTIVKAYEELKERGLVESKKLKGYFIISQETKVTLKIALLLFSFRRFQEDFYNTFREELGKRFQIDVFFHHNNTAIFDTIIANVRGKYGMYVVAPIPDPVIRPGLESIDPSKLLIIDRYIQLKREYSYICQEFEEATYKKLEQLLPAIRNFEHFVLFFYEDQDVPMGIKKAFNKFLTDYNISGSIKKNYKMGSVKKKHLYFFGNDTHLWDVLKDCRNKEYLIGRDVGVISHNDDVVKQLVFGGITTISTDFKDLAKQAADHIKNGTKTQVIVPLNLIKRNSL